MRLEVGRATYRGSVGFWYRWNRPFEDMGWPAARQWIESANWRGLFDTSPMYAIIDSVMASGRADDLAVTIIEGDLAVVAKPVPEPPMDVLYVLMGGMPWPTPPFPEGQIVLHYGTVSGHDTRSIRPPNQAVPLFWRYVHEKFGITAERPM